MWVVREFETMLNMIKTTGQLQARIQPSGPGSSWYRTGSGLRRTGVLSLASKTLPLVSHRSHGEILAKGMSSIEKLSDKELEDIMENFFDVPNIRCYKGAYAI